MSLLTRMQVFFSQYGFDRTYWVAYSGGLDSHVLLSLCKKIATILPIRLRVIHINHGLSPHAIEWAKHCAHVSRGYGIDYVEHTMEVKPQKGESLEEAAREQRYAFFASCMHHEDILLTAHQQDDQAETVLLQLFRGAGPKGLAAMPSIKAFAGGFHARPLLEFPRERLFQYAKEHQLHWLDDESNHSHKLTRNFIRHEILPLLKARWCTVTETISRTAQHCAETQLLLTEYALPEYKNAKGLHENTLSVSKLLQLDTQKQKLILRTWIERSGYLLPDAKKLKAIIHDVFTAKWDRAPCVKWDNVELRRYRDDLYLMAPLAEFEINKIYEWNITDRLTLPQIGILEVSPVRGRGLHSDIKKVDVRFRQGGESVHINGCGHHSLKNLFREWNVLPWERNRIPLIFLAEKLIAVVGHFIDPHFTTKNDELGHEVILRQ